MSRDRDQEAPPAPEPLAVPVLDSHTHLDIVVGAAGDEPGTDGEPATGGERVHAERVATQIETARSVGVDRLVQVGVDLYSSRWSARLAREHGGVLAAVALHPNEAPALDKSGELDEQLRAIEALAREERVRAIGETGLDAYRTGEQGRVAQEESFRAHIAIAKTTGRALVIHDRDAHDDVLRILTEEGAPERVVLHCFSGDERFAAECVRRGYMLSFAGTVTFKNAAYLREAARLTPLDQLLVETDAPFLTPMPYRGRPNAPYLVPLTVRSLAATLGRDLDKLCASISANGERVFGPWPAAAAPHTTRNSR